ncbi:MAG: hypothetical protein IK997_02165 [Bacilli bacterium]|nr:hypothetical protein [Bacilli bacterium]
MKDRVIYEAILFIVTFIIVLFVYKFINMPKKKKKQKKDPIEVILLRDYFKVDISKLDYRSLIRSISFISSLDVSIIITISCISNIGLVRIIIAVIIIIPVVFLSYLLFSKYCIKKIEKERRKRK